MEFSDKEKELIIKHIESIKSFLTKQSKRVKEQESFDIIDSNRIIADIEISKDTCVLGKGSSYYNLTNNSRRVNDIEDRYDISFIVITHWDYIKHQIDSIIRKQEGKIDKLYNFKL